MSQDRVTPIEVDDAPAPPEMNHIQTDLPAFGPNNRRYPLRVRVPIRHFEAHHAEAEVYEPNSYKDATEGPEGHLLQPAISEEYISLIVNNTWTLTSLPPG